jgi:hypothetical protein
MDEQQKLDVRIGQATKLAVLIKAHRAGVFKARTEEDRALIGHLDALLNPSDEPSRRPATADLEPLSDRDYITVFDALQERVDLLEKAWHSGMVVAETHQQREALAEGARALGPQADV